jgi:ABC-type sugar transport system ATPase subunit
MENTSWIRFQNIRKIFPGVLALDDVSFDIQQGEIMALCGENGAGKSTLINICAGLLKPDGGKVVIKGKEISFHDAAASEEARIATVHQEVPVCLNMTIAENMFLGPRPVTKGFLLDRKYMNEHTKKLLATFNLACRPSDKMGNLTIAEQSLIQILKAIDTKPEFLILDEPTSSLAEEQKLILFDLLRKMRKEQNVTILYVSHRMEEIMEIADKVVVLRDGKLRRKYEALKENSNSLEIAHTTIDEIIKLMVGREVEYASVYRPRPIGETILRVSNLNRGKFLKNIAFEVKRGEILGFSGFQGSGRTEVLRALFGLDSCDSINIEMEGKKIRIRRPEAAIKYGLAMISENRRDDGVIPNFHVQNNIIISALKKVTQNGFVSGKAGVKETRKYVEMMSIKLSSNQQLMVNLSGGNQQKVIIGRWLMTEPKVLFCDEPTRGIDVGAKAEIHSILMGLAEQGMAIVVVSSELPEIITISDRIIVMCEGRITGQLSREQFSEEAIVTLASDLSI